MASILCSAIYVAHSLSLSPFWLSTGSAALASVLLAMPVYPDKLLLSPPVLATLAVLLATARLYNAALDSLFLLYLTAGSIVLRLVFRYAGLFLLVLFCVSLLAGSW